MKNCCQRPVAQTPADSQHSHFFCFQRAHLCTDSKTWRVTKLFQFLQSIPYCILQRIPLSSFFRFHPIKHRAMKISAIVTALRVVLVFPTVQLSDFVPAVQHREAFQEDHHAMHKKVAADNGLIGRSVLLCKRFFNSAQAACCPAGTDIFSCR